MIEIQGDALVATVGEVTAGLSQRIFQLNPPQADVGAEDPFGARSDNGKVFLGICETVKERGVEPHVATNEGVVKLGGGQPLWLKSGRGKRKNLICGERWRGKICCVRRHNHVGIMDSPDSFVSWLHLGGSVSCQSCNIRISRHLPERIWTTMKFR